MKNIEICKYCNNKMQEHHDNEILKKYAGIEVNICFLCFRYTLRKIKLSIKLKDIEKDVVKNIFNSLKKTKIYENKWERKLQSELDKLIKFISNYRHDMNMTESNFPNYHNFQGISKTVLNFAEYIRINQKFPDKIGSYILQLKLLDKVRSKK